MNAPLPLGFVGFSEIRLDTPVGRLLFKRKDMMQVEVVDVFGCDAKISRMARISYGKLDHADPDQLPEFIGRLLRDGHLVPFEHCSLTYFLECPIYVARQLVRYRTAVISERSLRYCVPMTDEMPDGPLDEMIFAAYEQAWTAYNELRKMGLPRETARSVLPLGTRTQMYFTINLRNLMHLFDQRISGHAQPETRQVAFKMFQCARRHFPITFGTYWHVLCRRNDEADE